MTASFAVKIILIILPFTFAYSLLLSLLLHLKYNQVHLSTTEYTNSEQRIHFESHFKARFVLVAESGPLFKDCCRRAAWRAVHHIQKTQNARPSCSSPLALMCLWQSTLVFLYSLVVLWRFNLGFLLSRK